MGGGGMEKSTDAVKRDFSDIVLPGGLQDTVRALAAVTANTRAHGAPFRHMLFYGPPGESSGSSPPRACSLAHLVLQRVLPAGAPAGVHILDLPSSLISVRLLATESKGLRQACQQG